MLPFLNLNTCWLCKVYLTLFRKIYVWLFWTFWFISGWPKKNQPNYWWNRNKCLRWGGTGESPSLLPRADAFLNMVQLSTFQSIEYFLTHCWSTDLYSHHLALVTSCKAPTFLSKVRCNLPTATQWTSSRDFQGGSLGFLQTYAYFTHSKQSLDKTTRYCKRGPVTRGHT